MVPASSTSIPAIAVACDLWACDVEFFSERLRVVPAGTMYADHAACGPVAGCRKGMAGACNESPIMASLALQHMRKPRAYTAALIGLK